MISAKNGLKSLWIAGLFLAWFLCANSAAADMIGNAGSTDVSISNSWFGNLPASELNGWFFDSNQPSYPFQLDPSQQWTSAENIAMLNYWLKVATEMGNEAGLLAELNRLGLVVTRVGSTNQVSKLSPVGSQNLPSDVPEPEMLALFCAGLIFIASYAAVRVRRMRSAEIN